MRSGMEQRFAHDFGHVRVHDDAPAAVMAESLGAQALTVGPDVYLGEALPSFDEPEGQFVLAHELAHVVQHDRSGGGRRKALPFLSDPADAAESEANSAAVAVLGGGQPVVSEAPSAVASGFFDIFGQVNRLIAGAGNHGDDPTRGGSYGPHVYHNASPDGYSTTDRAGLGHVEGDAGSVDSLLYNSQRGRITEGDSTRYGMRDSFTGGRFSLNDSWLGNMLGLPTSTVDGKTNQNTRFGADIGAFTANQEASIGNDGFTLGAGANLLEGSISGGTRDPNSSVDEWARVGLSAGEGAAVRGHWGDADRDGRREYGFGFDAGPLSMDIKTEDPARTALRNILPGGSMYSDYALDALGVGRSDNLTDVAGRGARSAWDSASGAATDFWNDLPSIDTTIGMPAVDLPSLGTGFGGLDLPSLPSLPDLPSLPSLGTGFGGIDLPDMPEISLPSFDW